MADYNALFQQPNAGASFTNAFQQAQQMRQQQAERQMQMQEHQQDRQRQEQQAQMQQLEAHRENIIKGAQIFRQLGVKDEATYQQALQMAHQMGLPLEGVPPNYDPNYVNGVVQIANTFAPQQAQQGKDIPVQAGGSVLHVNPDGSTKWTVMPNGDAPPPLTDDQIRQMNGGQAGQPSPGGFPR